MKRLSLKVRDCRLLAGLLLVPLLYESPANATEQPDGSNQATPTEPAAAQLDVTASQESDTQQESSKTSENDSTKNKWKFATIGYAWLAGAWGKTDVIGAVPPVDLDLPFGKALEALKFAFMGAAEARHDRFVALGDLTFIHLDARKGIGIRDPDFVEAELDTRTAEITLLGGYRVVNEVRMAVDLLAGGRMNFFKTTLELEGPNRSAEGSVKRTWLDPLIAARVHAPLGGKWSLNAYGDVGGIIFGSDLTWQGVATVDYQISRKMTLGAGWRYFKVNYDDGDFLYDVYQSGPLIVFRTDL